MLTTKGIHHISSIVGHAQRNIDFYAGVLGYRLVKKTLNYDDKETYHLYYGNEVADSGLITTFPWTDAIEGEIKGGQVGVASYGIDPHNFDFWKERLRQFEVKSYEYQRFNRRRLGFKDPDGLQIELIETDKGKPNTWQFNGIDQQHAIKGIDSAMLYSTSPQDTLEILMDVLGYQVIDQDEEIYLLKIHDDFGGLLELSKKPQERGTMGIGVVHHIAFSVKDDELELWIKKLEEAGMKPTQVKDRKYFRSIYFREIGGILIELATEGPGMLVDEDVDHLGLELQIPKHFEAEIAGVIDNLMPLEVREVEVLEGYGYRDRYEYEHLQKRESIRQQIKDLKTKDHLTANEQIQLEQLKENYRNRGNH